MKFKKNILVTSKDLKIKNFINNFYFINETCYEYSNYKKILPPLFLKDKRSNKLLDNQYKQIIKNNDLLIKYYTDFLFENLKIHPSKKQSSILIGHWLNKFSQVVFRRYYLLTTCIKKFKIHEVALPKLCNEKNFIPLDSTQSAMLYNNQKWISFLDKQILNFIFEKKKIINDNFFIKGLNPKNTLEKEKKKK